MQVIGNSTSMPGNFSGISNSKSGINDLSGICPGNPFQEILQTTASKGMSINQAIEVVDDTELDLSQDQLEALKGILESLEKLVTSDIPGANELKEEFEEEIESGLMVFPDGLEKLDIPNLLNQLQNLNEVLQNFLAGEITAGESSEEELLTKVEKVSDELQSLLNNMQGDKFLNIQSTKLDVNMDYQTKTDLTVIKKLNAQRNDLIEEIQSLMAKASDATDPAKIAPKVLKLLEQWGALGKQLEKLNSNSTSQGSQSAKQLSPEVDSIWKTLAETYQKRTTMADKRVYNTVSKVTSADVAKWISNAVEANNQLSTVSGTAMPMHKLEQLAIHLTPLQSNQQQSEQFTSQFARIIDTSRFMQNGINGKPLTISLNPGNLGEIIVKMQRVNGELMVKLFVQSPEAKQLLESNLGQLRHMFSPHQVAVERQDAQQATSAQNAQQNEQGFRQDARDQEHQNRQRKANDQPSDELEEASFSELLMNAKV
ncbi:flagellar hook-length control protein FliK [Aciduricibacillus chroicocephali]|uniref:Flagellar hook-length control protein FliK n=1 Tax=Aciduricibacillus chroicocephali TaxID=3054939 RepID=A0ABY9KY36_9BACI|nr:flagellar hook-length control protein FliK [Bacillaceae bacterium 44XB]